MEFFHLSCSTLVYLTFRHIMRINDVLPSELEARSTRVPHVLRTTNGIPVFQPVLGNMHSTRVERVASSFPHGLITRV